MIALGGLRVALAYWLALPPLSAGQHLAGASEVRSRLAAAAERRVADRLAVEALLGSFEAPLAFGADLGRARAGLDALSDAELLDLASRAESLHADPAAGSTKGLIIVAVVLVLVVVIVAGIKDACRENPQDCDIGR